MTLSVSAGPRAPGAARTSGDAAIQGRVSVASRLGRRAAATWAELAGGRGLPAAVRAELALAPGERVLSAASDRDGECVLVATDRALYHRVPAGGGAGGWSRLGWEQVARVGWDAAAGQLIVVGVAGPATTTTSGATVAPRVAVPLARRGTVPELALDRVAHTRLGQWQLHLAGRRRAVIEARRRPVTGELVWSVTPDAGGQCDLERGDQDRGDLERGDLDIKAHAERAIARLSAEFGAAPQPGTGPSPLQSAIWRPPSGGRAAAAE